MYTLKGLAEIADQNLRDLLALPSVPLPPNDPPSLGESMAYTHVMTLRVHAKAAAVPACVAATVASQR